MVHWIDVKKRELAHNSLVDQRPRHAEFDPDGKRLWVSSEIGGTVTVFDVATKSEIKKLSFALPAISTDRIQPVGIRLTKGGALAFIALGPSNHIAVVDAKTYEIKSYLLVGRRVWHMALTPEEDLLFTTNGVSGDVSVVDVKALKVIKTIKVGRYPWGAVVLPTE